MIDKKFKTRRQQLGMPDRWRLLERIDPTVMVFIPDQTYDDISCVATWKRLGFARKSQIEELKKRYGDELEVIE